MAAGDVALNLIVSASTGAAMSALQGVGKGISDMVGGGAMGKLAEGSIAAGVAIVGIGVAAVKSAGDFQQSMTLLVTSAGESSKAISAVSAGILKMSVDTGTSTAQLAKGMYYIESAGYHGANGLNVLKTAAMGAKTENADLDTVAKALTTVLVDYGMKSTDSAKAMNGLIATVQNGKTNLQELASSMGAVLPIASAMHISFPQVAGAMATMTNAGMSARQAAQNLAHVLIALQSPSGVAVGSMQAVGLKAEDVKNALVNKGLPQALQLIEDHVGKKFPAGSVLYETALKNIMGGIVGLKLAAMLTGPSLQATKDNIDKISAAMKDGSGAVMGWTDIQGNFNFKIDQAKESLNVFMIALGSKLIPIVSQVLGAITPLIGGFTTWVQSIGSVTPAFSGMSSILAEISGMLRIMASNWLDLAASSAPVVTAFKEFGAIIGPYLKGAVAQFLVIAAQINLVLVDIGTAVSQWAVPAFKIFGQILQSSQTSLEPIIGAVSGQLVPALHNLITAVAPLITAFLNWVASSNVIPALYGAMSTAIVAVVTATSGLINGIASVTNFFKQNQAAADALLIPLGALGGILVYMAVTAIVAFLASLPAVISGLVIWGAAATVVAAATIATAAPFILVGVVVAAVIVGIILAIQHWGAISKWLEGAWSNTANFFKGIWTAIMGFFGGVGKWFQDRFNEAKKGIQTAWGDVGSWFGDRWKNITDTAKSGANNVQSATTSATTWIANAWKASSSAVVDALMWQYNHNYYVKDLCDAITNFFKAAIAWIQKAWTVSVAWLAGVWQGLTHIATVAWTAVTGAINVALTAVSKAVQVGWTTTVNWLTLAWNNLKSLAADAWKRVGDLFSSIWTTYIVHPLTILGTNISSWWASTSKTVSTDAGNLWSAVSKIFSDAWTNYIVKPMTSLGTFLAKWFTDLGTSFGKWASNAMAMFTGGITNGVKGVQSAISGIASTISKILGYHSPPAEGPLSTSDQWMPSMCTMLATGITANTPKVTNSVTNMATGVNNQFTNMNNQVGTSVNNLNNTVNNGFQNMSANVASNSNNINNSMNGLQSNVSSKSSAINSSIAGMSTGAIANLNNLNGQVQTVSTTIPKAMTTVGSSVAQVTPVIAGATVQWTQNMVDASQIVDSNSKKAITSVSTAATAIPKYAEAFQKGTNQMSASAAEGMSKANQTISTGSKQAQSNLDQMGSALKKTFSDIGQVGADFEKANQSLMKSIVDSAKAAAQMVAQAFQSMVGHSTPKEGPMRGDDEWGEHFMQNLVGGMHKGMPQLTSTINTVASVLAGGIKIPLLTTTPGLAASNIAEGILSKIALPQNKDPDWQRDLAQIHIHLDSKEIGNAVLPRIAKEIHVQAGVRKL